MDYYYLSISDKLMLAMTYADTILLLALALVFLIIIFFIVKLLRNLGFFHQDEEIINTNNDLELDRLNNIKKILASVAIDV